MIYIDATVTAKNNDKKHEYEKKNRKKKFYLNILSLFSFLMKLKL